MGTEHLNHIDIFEYIIRMSINKTIKWRKE